MDSKLAQLEEDGYPVDAVAELNARLTAQEQELMSLRESQQKATQGQFHAEVSSHLDSLGLTDLFGTANQFEQKQSENATLVAQDVMAMVDRGFKLTPELVQRAVNLNFGTQIAKSATDTKTKQLVQQSKRTRPKTNTKASSRDNVPWDGEPADDPELHKFWAERKKQRAGL